MGIIRLTLITAVLIWLAMYYFGRSDGLPPDRLGRVPQPEAPVAVADTPAPEAGAAPEETPAAEAPAPAPEPAPTAPEPEAVEPTAATDPVDAAIAEAIGDSAPDPVAEPEPEPDPAPAAEPDTVLYVTGARVNVRAGPSTNYEAITALTRGTAVTDVGPAGNGWREILLDTGETGFMSGDFLSPDPQ
ncbi:SH3 domain-containing protein [Sinisalibacter aestuarii]|uniref:SH3b domain-containing protein n=1 Tax=Sinisalibacter aestuarii TaxID=2949426 RepID=A0ABQ5LU64_9RHOB|nr:SH3 domain-containing protein [Sinisalibacter aestuarii]GKY88529.1 hypothetical protein STA1M1_23980 [Sinisalibacter aestuarii]